MKNNKKFWIFLLVFFIFTVFSADYYKKSQVTWYFSEKELKLILTHYLESKGTNVPPGQIELQGLEKHYLPSGRLELIVKE